MDSINFNLSATLEDINLGNRHLFQEMLISLLAAKHIEPSKQHDSDDDEDQQPQLQR